jgi:hypothetical protein|tara:strand:- start:520 stop:1851 length:1332 start_codon:yes stop_codon:yes gene_type:complete
LTNLSDKYLIIGAGPSGLCIARAFKESGVPYDQVEADDDVGGNWYHGAYKTANILSSRDVTEFPEFPMPDSYPDFPSQKQMYEYYKLYSDHYDLTNTIKFKTKLLFTRPIEDNLWEATFDILEKKSYKGVIVCNGHHWSRRYPKYPGEFNGEILHSKDYKTPEQLRDKSVLVVGAGNSAFDISSEASRVGANCFMSVRRGVWVFPKVFMGKPLSAFRLGLPVFMKKRIAKLMLRLSIGNLEEYGFPKPEIDLFDRHPTINTDTLINIKNGRIKVKGEVKRLIDNSVEFEDGSIEDIDTIVYATGFNVDFPFLPNELSRVNGSTVKVYGYTSYEDYLGLFIVGWFQPRGGIGSLLSPLADLIVKLTKIEESTMIPIGRIYKEMGEEIASSHLFGGIDMIDWIAKKNKQTDKMLTLGNMLKEKGVSKNNVIHVDTDSIRNDIQVF